MLPIISARVMQWQDEIPKGPWRLKVFPTYRCNIDCGICIRSWFQSPAVLYDELSDERWLRLIDEAAALGVRYLTIGGGGEPMLRESLVREMCVKAKQHGMEGHLQTNGTRLSQETIETLLKAKWDYITISVDGPSEEVNDAIRCEGTYIKTAKTLRLLKKIKEERQSSFPIVSIHMTITALNYNLLEDMVAWCLEHGVELLAASPLLDDDMKESIYILSEDQRKALPDLIEKAIRTADEAGLPHTLNSLRGLGKIIGTDTEASDTNHSWPPRHIAAVKCLEPWTSLTIVSSGHVSPCCFFWEERADSIRDKNLEEIWTGPYLTEIRRQMRSNTIPPYCVNCYYPDAQEHRELLECVRQRAMIKDTAYPGLLAVPIKIFKSVAKHGGLGSLRRFREWLVIWRNLSQDK